MKKYDAAFYKSIRRGSRSSAEELVPLIIEMANPRSVIDVGCGTGAWLSVFQNNGISDVYGIDGPHVRKESLEISSERFMHCDLMNPPCLDRMFDLAICLEVIEHIPADHAENMVDFLIGLSPLVLFSAAIPYQDGVIHINEQWPEYWVGMFRKKGYVAIDCLREKVWNNDRVEYWYSQNIMFFVKMEDVGYYPLLKNAYAFLSSHPLPLVHPKQYLKKVKLEDFPINELLAAIYRKTMKVAIKRLRRL